MEPDPVAPAVDAPASTASFRRRAALLALLMNVAIAVPLLFRDTDIGPNAAELMSWIVIANGLAILGAIGFKALESLAILKGHKP